MQHETKFLPLAGSFHYTHKMRNERKFNGRWNQELHVTCLTMPSLKSIIKISTCWRCSLCINASCNSCLYFCLMSLISSSSCLTRPSWVSASSFAARYSCLLSAALCLSFSRVLLNWVCSALRHEICNSLLKNKVSHLYKKLPLKTWFHLRNYRTWASRTLIRDKVWDKRSFTDRSLSSAVAALASASCRIHRKRWRHTIIFNGKVSQIKFRKYSRDLKSRIKSSFNSSPSFSFSGICFLL